MELQIDIFPLIYVIDGLILLYLRRRVSLYSLEDNIISSLGKRIFTGILCLTDVEINLGQMNWQLIFSRNLELAELTVRLLINRVWRFCKRK